MLVCWQLVIWLELDANDLHVFGYPVGYRRHIHRILLQSNPDWFGIILDPAYPGGPAVRVVENSMGLLNANDER